MDSSTHVQTRKHKSLSFSTGLAGARNSSVRDLLAWEREWLAHRQQRLTEDGQEQRQQLQQHQQWVLTNRNHREREEERLSQLMQRRHGEFRRQQLQLSLPQQLKPQSQPPEPQPPSKEELLEWVELDIDGNNNSPDQQQPSARLHEPATTQTTTTTTSTLPSKSSSSSETSASTAQTSNGTSSTRRMSPLIKSKTIGNHTQQGNDHLHASENQDRHLFYWDEERSLLWLAVIDGHSGSAAADFLCAHLISNIDHLLPTRVPYTREALMNAIRSGIIETENQFRKEDQPDGACLLLACLFGEWLVVANVGDSRAVLGSYSLGSSHRYTSRTLTNDHNATNEVEAKLARFRFLKNNGVLPPSSNPADYTETQLIEGVKEVMEGSDIIENGRLLTVQLTRSIGDFGIKRCCFDVVSNEPEFTVLKLCEEDRLLILASDGVWATVSADRAVNMVMEKIINLSSYFDHVGPAEYLVQEAVSKGSGDDQTALVLDLKKYRKGLLKPHHATLSGVSPLERTIKKGLFLSDRQNRLNSNMYGSATRSFGAKMALLHAKGSFIGSSEPNKFEVDAKKAQSLASSAHKSSTTVPPVAPLRSSVLGLFESAAVEESKAREAERKKKGFLYGRTYF